MSGATSSKPASLDDTLRFWWLVSSPGHAKRASHYNSITQAGIRGKATVAYF